MYRVTSGLLGALGLAGMLSAALFSSNLGARPDKATGDAVEEGLADHEFALPRTAWLTPFKDEVPIHFVNQNNPGWASLKSFWNETTETVPDPTTGQMVTRKAIQIKVPLGLGQSPPVPVENPMTLAKWKLGKRLFYDQLLSSDGTVSCATCHDPKKGFTDQAHVSTGISGKKGGVSAPTVFNSAYGRFQFWDGRALSLEDQSQGPVQNALEMFDGTGHAWKRAVKRLRADKGYVAEFKAVFGTLPTRDAFAKAVATYERTVLSGNSIQDRAEVAARVRAMDLGIADFTPKAPDYTKALKDAFAARDVYALKALGLDAAKDSARAADFGKRLAAGRELFFNKARCNSCHVGDNYSDGLFHNLGVGAKDGIVPPGSAGRYATLPTGHKDPATFGAFKTPILRHLLDTAPYMHDGSEKDLEKVVDFYDKGGNPNEFLDIRMRDEDAERAWRLAKAAGKKYKGATKVYVFNGKPIAPLPLKLTTQEKKDLILFMRGLQGDPAPAIVADPKLFPK